jgi:hypothetical protein
MSLNDILNFDFQKHLATQVQKGVSNLMNSFGNKEHTTPNYGLEGRF